MTWILVLYFLTLLVFLPAYIWSKDKGFICSVHHTMFLFYAGMFSKAFLIGAVIDSLTILVIFLIALKQRKNRIQKGVYSK